VPVMQHPWRLLSWLIVQRSRLRQSKDYLLEIGESRVLDEKGRLGALFAFEQWFEESACVGVSELSDVLRRPLGDDLSATRPTFRA